MIIGRVQEPLMVVLVTRPATVSSAVIRRQTLCQIAFGIPKGFMLYIDGKKGRSLERHRWVLESFIPSFNWNSLSDILPIYSR